MVPGPILVGQRYRRKDGKIATVNKITGGWGAGASVAWYDEMDGHYTVWASGRHCGMYASAPSQYDFVELISTIPEQEQLSLF